MEKETEVAIAILDPSLLGEELIKIDIAENRLGATVSFQLSREQLQNIDREALKKTIVYRLRQQRVSFGIDTSALDGELESEVSYTVAKALEPVNGANAIIHMIEKPELTPELHEDGSVDFYNINLMIPIQEGDWLGEKEPATSGTDGMDISGRAIRPRHGADVPLLYDKESVAEEEEQGVIVLRAIRNGMLHFVNDIVRVINHQTYDDIDFATGNIDFDGSITVKGTVADGFSVRAS
ncbi:MAG: FapA family protein, partial [Symbiobacteriaceae bacterium]|nr:FapA family protein [Symbiobacteriaceae bacterium]